MDEDEEGKRVTDVGWWTGIVAILTAAGASMKMLWPVIAASRARAQAKRERRELENRTREAFGCLVDLWAKRATVRSSARQLVQDSVADRVIVIRSENGGGVPTPSSPVYISVVEEETADGVPRIRPDWQKKVPSHWYEQSVLLPLCAEGHVSLLAENIPEREPLRLLYEVQHVQRAEMYVIGATPKRALIYASIAWRTTEEPSPRDRYLFDVFVTHLQRLYREDHELLIWETERDSADRVSARIFAPEA